MKSTESIKLADMQLTYDALRIPGFDLAQLEQVATGFNFFGGLARAGKIAQGRFIARKR